MGDNSFSKKLLTGLFIVLGLLTGILMVPALDEKGSPYILGAIVLLFIAAFVIFVRVFMMKQKKMIGPAEGNRKGSEVGFVVDTFHELVAKLKEKETELEKLKGAAEEKAVRMEAYNENILQSVPSGVITIDNSLKIRSINQAAEKILGLDAEEVIDRNFTEVFREPLSRLVANEKTVSREEHSYITGDKRHIWLGITTSQLKNAEGEKIGLIFVFTDLTDIKALQAQVEMKQRLSQLGEMSAGISHELRNSMSVISGYARLLARKADDSSRPTIDSILTEISDMDKIISELLAFAKPSVLHKEEVNLHNLINETVMSAAGGIDKVKVTFNSNESISIKADLVLLRQALSNLFINAVEAMPEGGSLDIDLSRNQNNAAISIRDSGPGISDEIRQKIFLPFYTTKQEGTGLGLALVQKIIVSHGGRIEVEGGKGQGTTFIISLPAAS